MEKGSSSSSSSSSSSLNGLQFGKKIYFEGSAGGQSPAAPRSPAKKGRTGLVQGGQPPRCQVLGCQVDLSDAKAYYSRHKVCGMHSKSPTVIVAGLEQRFCQQCSRFHQLPEFDQGKRSCRRRLAGHNERRRKPPPGSMLSPRYGNLCPSMFDNPSKTGGFVMDFSSHPTRESWPNAASQRGLGNEATAITGGKYQLPWQGSNSQNPLSNLLLGTASRPGLSDPVVSSEGCFPNSTNALSLLSNQPTWDSRSRSSLSLGVNNNTTFPGSTMVQPSVNHGSAVGQFACSSSWGFKGNQGNNTTLHGITSSPDLGLGQASHHVNGPYSGELVLAQPSEGQFHEVDHSRGFESSSQHMHWSL